MAAGVRTRTKSAVGVGRKIEFVDADSRPYQVVLQVGELPQTLRRDRTCESGAFSWRMMMPVCAYSCVIDAINAAVVNAEVCPATHKSAR